MLVAAGRNDRVDEHFDLAVEPCTIALEPDRLLEREQLVETFPLLGRRHVVGELRRRGPGSHGVRRREDLVVADRLEEAERGFELFAGLAAEPDDHVGRDRDPGHGGADRSEPLEVVLDRVLAAHPAQDGVVARLDRQVQVLAHGPAVREGRDQAIRQVPRVRGHEAQPRDRRAAVAAAERVDRADQLGEVRPPVEVELATGPPLGVDVREARLGRQVVAVAVDVLAEERDLAVAGGGQRPRLVDDLVERTAALRARG